MLVDTNPQATKRYVDVERSFPTEQKWDSLLMVTSSSSSWCEMDDVDAFWRQRMWWLVWYCDVGYEWISCQPCVQSPSLSTNSNTQNKRGMDGWCPQKWWCWRKTTTSKNEKDWRDRIHIDKRVPKTFVSANATDFLWKSQRGSYHTIATWAVTELWQSIEPICVVELYPYFCSNRFNS